MKKQINLFSYTIAILTLTSCFITDAMKMKRKELNQDFMLAVAENNTEKVKLLIDSHADVDIKSNGWPVLVTAAFGCDSSIVRMLVEAGADVDETTHDGYTALMWAAYKCREDIVKLLLEHNANANKINHHLGTALIWAARGGNEKIIKLLLNAGADAHAKDMHNQSALSYASSSNPSCCEMLVEAMLLSPKTQKNRQEDTNKDKVLREINKMGPKMKQYLLNKYLPNNNNTPLIHFSPNNTKN